MNRTLGQWNAYAEAGATREDRRRRMEEAPEELRADIFNHLRTVWALKVRAQAKRDKSWRRQITDKKKGSS